MSRWILRGHEPVEVDTIEWARWYETADRRVARTKIGEILVSTVFLGLDYNYSEEGPPILFETMVFRGPLDGEMERYATWEEAERGHAAMVRRIEKLLNLRAEAKQ